MKTNNAHAYIRHLAAQCAPSMRYDGQEDFYAWQARARQQLEALLKMPREKCDDEMHILSECETAEYRRTDFEFQSEPGYFVLASLLVPAGCAQKRPAVICIQGHSTGMHISLGEARYPGDEALIAGGRDFALQAVREGYCAVTIEQRYMGASGHGKSGAPSCLTDNEGMATLLLGRTAIGERVWDIQRLIDVLIKHFSPVVDENKIVCMGNSGGGTATFYASCMDERIAVSVPSCSVCTYEASIMAMQHCPCNFVPGIRQYFDMGDLGGLIAPRPIVVVCGEQDPIFPLHGVEESYVLIQRAYRAAGKEMLCSLVKGKGGHQFYPDDAWPVVRKYLQ